MENNRPRYDWKESECTPCPTCKKVVVVVCHYISHKFIIIAQFSQIFLIDPIFLEPWFSVSNGDVLLYYSEQLKGKRGNQVIDFDCGNCILKDDTKIEFFHRN